MPDPNWSTQFNFSQTPETNGFTRQVYGTPVIQEVTSGSQANRRVEINTDAGSVVWGTTQVPSLDPTIGCTLEYVCNCTGTGNAGIELTFLSRVVAVQVYAAEVRFYTVQDGVEPPPPTIVLTTANSANTTIRVTFDSSNNVRVYRNGTLIIGPQAVPVAVKPFQRVLWWAEEGGVQTFRTIKVWLGGAMAPG